MDPQNARWLLIAAAADVVLGVVLGVVGQVKDVSELSIFGLLLLLSGLAVAAVALTKRNRTPSR